MKKTVKVFVIAIAMVMALSAFGMAVFADVAPDYSDAVTLANAILANYTKNFDACDSTSGSVTVQGINAALDKALADAGSTAHWNDTYKSWTVVKNGASNYVILSTVNPEDVETGKFAPATKVEGGTVTVGVAKVTTRGTAYRVFDVNSFSAANGAADLVIGKDCADMPLLLGVLREAISYAKTNIGNIPGTIDSTSVIWSRTQTDSSGYAKLTEAIDTVLAQSYDAMGLSVDYTSLSWRILINNGAVVELYVTESVTDNMINTDESLRAEGVKIIVYKFDFATGEFIKGQAAIVLNTDKNALNTGSYRIDSANWEKIEQQTPVSSEATSSELTSSELTSSVITSSELTSSELTSSVITSSELTSSELTSSAATSSEVISSQTSSVESSVVSSEATSSAPSAEIIPESVPLAPVPSQTSSAASSADTLITIEPDDVPLADLPATGAFSDVKILLMAGSGLLFAVTPMLGKKKEKSTEKKEDK